MDKQSNFINLQDYVQKNDPSEGQLLYGKSPITITTADGTKATRRIRDILRGCFQNNIFSPHLVENNDIVLNDKDHTPGSAIIHDKTGLAFVETQFDNSKMFSHTRLLSTDPARGRFHNVKPSFLREPSSFTIVSGTCLFSAPGVRAIDETGNSYALIDPGEQPISDKIVQIAVDPRIQPYEVEAMGRLTSVIQGLNAEKSSRLVFSVPRLEYWHYALDAYEQGFIDEDLMFQWFIDVDQRAQRVINQLLKRVDIPVDIATPLAPVEEFLRDAVSSGRRRLLPELVNILQNSSPLWKAVIAIKEPKRFIEIGYMSYTMGYIETAKSEDNLVVAVENPEEIKIIDRTQELLEHNELRALVKPPTIVGVYPHPNVVLKDDPSHGQGKRDLYFFAADENNMLNSLKEIRMVAQSAKPQNEA